MKKQIKLNIVLAIIVIIQLILIKFVFAYPATGVIQSEIEFDNETYYGNLIIDGMLTAKEVNVTSNDSIYLNFLTIKNEGTHSSLDTDLAIMVHEEPTVYFAIQSHNDTPDTKANFIMEAGSHMVNSVLNIVKNGPLAYFAANASGIINEGDHGTFVGHDDQISWWHYESLDKDEYGNIYNLTGYQRLMMLNDSSLNLEEVNLIVNGSGEFTADSNGQSLRLYENSGGEYINVKMDSDGDLNFYSDAGDVRLEIPDSNQQGSHAYRGIGVNALYHLFGDDTDTTMQFGDDLINFYAGDSNLLEMRNWVNPELQDFVAVNYLNEDVDFKWDSDTINDAVFFEGSSGRVGIGTNEPARTLHIQDDNGVIRIDRDANSPAFILARFPNNNYTTPWKTFIFGVNAFGEDNGTFHITDIHTNVAGGGNKRLIVENDGTVNIPGNLVSDKIYLQDSGSDYMGWSSGDGVFQFTGGLYVGGELYVGDISGAGFTGTTIDATDEVMTPLIYNTDGDTLEVRDKLYVTGNVGIGTDDPEYIFNLLSNTPIIKLENARTIMGMGYNVGGLLFYAGEDGLNENVATINVAASEAWTNESYPTRMDFYTTAVGSTRALQTQMTINPNGYVGIGEGFDTIKQNLHVGGSIQTNEAIFFNDGSTLTSSQDGFLGHISTAVFRQSISVAAQDTSPRDMQFKPDGTKVYISGVAGNGIIWEYDLSDPFNISSMTYNSNYFNVNTWESNPMGLFIGNDGKKMYVSGSGGDEVNEFNLGTAWDITSASWVSLYDVSGEDTSPSGVEFRPDGQKMYIIGDQHNDVTEYDLTTAWDITTASPLQTFGTDINAPTGFRFKQDGTRMYVMDGSVEDDIHEYILSTPWDISTAILQELFDVSSQNGVPQDVAFSPDFTKAYMLGSTSPASLFEYDLGIRSEGKIIGDGSELTGIPLYFTCGENGDLAPGAQWSCGGNGEVNQYFYLWDDVTATGMAMDCNTGNGTAVIRLETLSGGDTGCSLTSTGENEATTFDCDIDSDNWVRPYTVSNGGHASCVLTMRFETR